MNNSDTSQENDTRLVFPSAFNEELTVVIIYPEDSEYDTVSAMFESSHAFLLHELRTIVIDGADVNESWFTDQHLDVIQAHELGHFYIRENSIECDNEEMCADAMGIEILGRTGTHLSSCDLHKAVFIERYGNLDALSSNDTEHILLLNKKLNK